MFLKLKSNGIDCVLNKSSIDGVFNDSCCYILLRSGVKIYVSEDYDDVLKMFAAPSHLRISDCEKLKSVIYHLDTICSKYNRAITIGEFCDLVSVNKDDEDLLNALEIFIDVSGSYNILNNKKLGKYLAKNEGVLCDGLSIESRGLDRNGSKRWWVRK